MTINAFVYINNLEPGDVVVAKKAELFGILDHYIVFTGWNAYQNQYEFVANFQDGVKLMPSSDIQDLIKKYVPTRIRKFVGDHNVRDAAIKRVHQKLNLKEAYNLFRHNCEHFANYVQLGKEISLQSQKAGLGLIGTGLITATVSKNKNIQLVGGGMAALGLLLLILEKNKEDKSNQ